MNPDLYYMVFGESLLNDGVAVVGAPSTTCSPQVLYKMMNSFAGIMSTGASPTLEDCLMGLLSFCTIALGGLLIGDKLITPPSPYSTILRDPNWCHHCPHHQVHQGGPPVLQSPATVLGACSGAPGSPHHCLPFLHVR